MGRPGQADRRRITLPNRPAARRSIRRVLHVCAWRFRRVRDDDGRVPDLGVGDREAGVCLARRSVSGQVCAGQDHHDAVGGKAGCSRELIPVGCAAWRIPTRRSTFRTDAAPGPGRATDDLLERLIPVVRAGVVGSGPLPFDDPMSLYEDSPEPGVAVAARDLGWAGACRPELVAAVLRSHGRRRAGRDAGPARVQFAALGTIGTFSWLGPGIAGAASALKCARPRCTWRSAGWLRARRPARHHEQRRIQPHVPGAGLRAERYQLGYPPRRTRADDTLEADPGPLGEDATRRY